MPAILQAVLARPPAVFVIQTRGPLVLRDLALLRQIPNLRVSFSVTTDRDDVRALYEPHCVPIEERWRTMRELRQAGIAVYATLAPLLPCNPELLITQALGATVNALIADPLHVRRPRRGERLHERLHCASAKSTASHSGMTLYFRKALSAEWRRWRGRQGGNSELAPRRLGG